MALAPTRAVTVVETYPAECYRQLGLARRFAETRSMGPRSQATALRADANGLGATLDPALAAELDAGFPAALDHGFDALVGCLGLLAALQGRRAEGVPEDPAVTAVEGWMVGVDGSTIRGVGAA